MSGVAAEENTYLPGGEGREVQMGSSMGQRTACLFLARNDVCEDPRLGAG